MKRIIAAWVKVLLSLSFCALISCAALPPTPPTNPPGTLYAVDSFNIAVYAFTNALTITGAATPARTISGNTNTHIAAPTVCAVDSIRDILYVADTSSQSILAFSPASTLNGDVAPIKIYPGVSKAGAIFFDDVPGHDRLYVTDVNNSVVVAYDSISSLSTGTGPTRTIKLGYTPSGMVVDTQRDLLYVGDPSLPGVKSYGNASTTSSGSANAPVKNSFTDSTRPFQEVNGLALNIPNDTMFVTEASNIFSDDNNPDNDFSPSVEIFGLVSTITGINTSQPASREIMGADTGLSVQTTQPHFFVADSVATLWVIANNNTINVWNDANQVGNAPNNDAVPTRSIQVNVSGAVISNFDVDLSH